MEERKVKNFYLNEYFSYFFSMITPFYLTLQR